MCNFLKSKAVFQIFLIVMISICFAIFMSKDVEAADYVCCEKTTSGEYCVFTDPSNCDGMQANSACENTYFCQLGMMPCLLRRNT